MKAITTTIDTLTRRTLLAALIMISAATNATAQSLSLRVSDSNGKPLAGIAMTVEACDKSFRATTDKQGLAHVDVGDCDIASVLISTKFYQDVDTVVNVSAETIKLTLGPKTRMLKDVVVKAIKPMVRGNAEKDVYSVDTRGFLKDSKANEVLMFLPGIESDGNSFKILGKQANARFKIDGVNVSADEVKNLNAADIERVEVKNIDADDDASSSGVINIIRKKRQAPKFYGSVRNHVNTVYEMIMSSGDLNYQDKHWELGLNLGLQYSKSKTENDVERTYFDTGARQSFHEKRESKPTATSQLLKVGYYPTDRLSLMLRGIHIYRHNGMTSQTRQPDAAETYLDQTGKSESYIGLFNAFYNLTTANRLLLKGAVYDSNSKTIDNRHVVDDYKNDFNEYSVALQSENDRVKWLGGGNVNLGWQSVWRRNKTQSTDWSTYSIHQLYLEHSQMFGKKFSTYIILKGETDNFGHERNCNFLPSLRLNYNMGRAGSLAAFYQRTVERPGIDFQNTDTLYISEYQRLVGNPYLTSQHNNNMGLSYRKQIKSATLSLALGYYQSDDIISQSYPNPDDYNTFTYSNAGRNDYASLSAGWTQRLCKGRMNFTLTLTGDYANYDVKSQYKDETLLVPSKGFGAYGSINFSYRTTKSWMYSFWGTYHPKRYAFNALTHLHPMFRANITKNFFNNRLGLGLTLNNSLRYVTTSHTGSNFRNMKQTSMRKSHSNDVMISITWNFGKRFNERKQIQDIETGDLQHRDE